ncbi:MAG: lactate racemase domain-containing protein [Planctomycetaceae bacterium]
MGELAAAGVRPGDVIVLQPADRLGPEPPDPRSELPPEVRPEVRWRVHDFDAKDGCGYLASSAGGERLYVARDALEADVIITVGQIAYDSVIGYRGTNSVFYPGLSNAEAAQRAQGQGHSELGPEHERPLRLLTDEVGWLLGAQFTVQTLPAADGGVLDVVAGLAEPVLRRAKKLLARDWTVQPDFRCDLVLASVDGSSPGDPWRKLAAAAHAAHGIVARGGKIVLLSDIDAEIGDGLTILRESAEPADALQPLRNIAPPDMLPAMQLASAADWAVVYLLSELEDDLAEDLFLTPLQDHDELERLLARVSTCAMLESAEFISARVAE